MQTERDRGEEIDKAVHVKEALRRSLEKAARAQRLLLALSQAAQAVQRARTPEEVYQTIGEEIASLGFDATIFTLSDDGTYLVASHTTFDPALLRAAEKLTGLSAQGYRFRLVPDGFYQRVIAEGQTVFSDPGAESIHEALPGPARPLAGRLATLLKVGQAIYAPLEVDGVPHGVLTVIGADLTEDDVPAVTAFANQTAIAIENARLYEETAVLKAFNEDIVQGVGEAILIQDVEGILTFVNPTAEGLLGYSGQELVGQHWTTIVLDTEREGMLRELAKCAQGIATRYETTLLNKQGRAVPVLASARPLFSNGRLASVLAAFADITDLNRRAVELSTLLEASRAISSTLDLEQMLAIIAEQMLKVTEVAGCTISRWDKEADMLVTWLEWRQRWPEYADPPGTRYAVDDFPSTRTVLERRQPVAIQVTDPDADPAEVALMRRQETLSLLMLPLTIGERVIGLVELDEDEHERVFTPVEIRLCQALADQAAIAIENAALHAETQRRLQVQTALQEASAIISSVLDLPEVLSRVAEQMAVAIDASSGYICSIDRQARTSSVLAEYFSPRACAAERVSDLGVTYEEIDERFLEPLLSGQLWVDQLDDPDLPEADRRDMQRYGAQSILYVPLYIRGQTLGYAELWESRRRREFTAEEKVLCQAMARNAAIALENARLYEQGQQELAQRVRVEAQVKASLREKEVLLKEIHHRVKNNLQVISSLLNLQSAYIEDQRALELFKDSRHRVRSMALIHEKLYRSPDLARVDFGEYIPDLVTGLIRSYTASTRPVAVRTNVNGVCLGIDTALPCGLIVSELVSNSLKHAFPPEDDTPLAGNTPPTEGEGGQIRVELLADDHDQLTLIVGDNGIGFPEEFEFHNTASLGLQLVTGLVGQLDGSIELDRSQGTEFKITFPAPSKRSWHDD